MSDPDETAPTEDTDGVEETTISNHHDGTDTPQANAGKTPSHGQPDETHTTSVPAVDPPNVWRNGPPERGDDAEATGSRQAGIEWGEQFFDGGESITHLWGKLALHRRRHAKTRPWFQGTYEFERTVADRVADCLITDDKPQAWIEFVVNSEQEYRAKTQVALRFGYPIYWVILDGAETQRQAARNALRPDLDDTVEFGRFNPEKNRLTLGDAVTFGNYRARIESREAFRVRELGGYRIGAAHIPQVELGYDLGWVQVEGNPRRAYGNRYSSRIWLVTPGEKINSTDSINLDNMNSDLARQVEAGTVERLGPIPRTSTYERRTEENLPMESDE